MSASFLSPDSLKTLAWWLTATDDSGVAGRAELLQSAYLVHPEDEPGLVAAYRLGGLMALGDAHGALVRERGWKLLGL